MEIIFGYKENGYAKEEDIIGNLDSGRLAWVGLFG
jgi:hypothetical protein